MQSQTSQYYSRNNQYIYIKLFIWKARNLNNVTKLNVWAIIIINEQIICR